MVHDWLERGEYFEKGEGKLSMLHREEKLYYLRRVQ